MRGNRTSALSPQAQPAVANGGLDRGIISPSRGPSHLLARLAVTVEEQGKGLGRYMLLDALRRSVEGAEVIGGRAVLVHAKDERARSFYLHHGFEPSPTDDLHLLLLMTDLRRTLGL